MRVAGGRACLDRAHRGRFGTRRGFRDKFEAPMKLRAIQGWAPRWLPLLGVLIVIGIAFDLLTRSRLSATPGLACEGEYADSLQVQSLRTRDLEQGPRG